MKINLAKDFFELGVIAHICAIRDPVAPGCWLMQLEDKNGKQQMLRTARNHDKRFFSLDALIKDAERIVGSIELLTIKQQSDDELALWLLCGGNKAAFDQWQAHRRRFTQAAQMPELNAHIKRFRLERLIDDLRQGKAEIDDGNGGTVGGNGPGLHPEPSPQS